MPDTRSRQRIDHLAETEALPQTVANAQNRDAATPTLDPNKANAPDIETPFADTSHPRARTRKTHTKHDSDSEPATEARPSRDARVPPCPSSSDLHPARNDIAVVTW